MQKEIIDWQIRPADGQQVIYYFEPFDKWYCGAYDAQSDSVFGKSGFTSWVPEVTAWMANEPLGPQLTHRGQRMKTEKEIIDELGEWLCRDIEKDLEKQHLPMTSLYDRRIQVSDIAKRIKFYRDNCI